MNCRKTKAALMKSLNVMCAHCPPFLQFNGEPRSYTRFNLAQNNDVDSSQVEMKLSSDVEDEVGNPEDGHAPITYTQSPLQNYKKVCYLALGTLVIFILGKYSVITWRGI